MRRILAGFLAIMVGLPAMAVGPDTSVRPVARGDTTAEARLPATRPAARPAILEAALAKSLVREMQGAARPGLAPDLPAPSRALAFVALSPMATGLSLRPTLRPPSMITRVMAKKREAERGSVCADVAIQGERVGYVPGRIEGCGIADAVRVNSVSGVALSQRALMDCTTAKALKRWVDEGLKPAVGQYGGGVAQIRVAAHYACRTRNNIPGGRLSEHAGGRAIDISAFRLRDGKEITVLRHWGSREYGAKLRRMHGAACGPFGTVLGPESDRFHRDHFHFDTARYRSGAYCR